MKWGTIRMEIRVEYKREMNRNYMVAIPEGRQEAGYAIRMLSENPIPGFLPFQEKKINGDVRYYYDITSKQPLERILEYRNLTGEELRHLVSDLVFSLRQMERFLLDESQVILKPEYIYVEPDVFKCFFCLLPGKKGDFPNTLRDLSQYLLDHVNHEDGRAVILAFSIFKECKKENFGMEDIERCLQKPEREAVEKEAESRTFPQQKREIRQQAEWEPEKEQEKEQIPEREQEPFPESENSKEEMERGAFGGYGWILSVLGMVILPVMTFVFLGGEGVLQYKWILGALELFLGVSAKLLFEKERKSLKSKGKEDIEEAVWEVCFQDEKDQGSREYQPPRPSRIASVMEQQDDLEEEMQTMLLTAHPIDSVSRRLVSMSEDMEIPIGYFPFLIGKSKGIVDFCLNEPGISRLHIKIEETAQGYSITDLNSTNGTRVDGKLLEANATCDLLVGSEVEIAGQKFKFQ